MTRRAKGEGALYQDNRGRWVGQADVGLNAVTGKRRRIKVTGRPGESKAEVAKRLAERIEQHATQGPPITIVDMCEQWLVRSAPKRKSPKSLADDRRLVELHILPRFGSVPIESVTVELVEEWLDGLLNKLSRSTVVKVKGQLAMAFDFAIALRHTSWNPARLADLAAAEKPRQDPMASCVSLPGLAHGWCLVSRSG